MVLVYMHWIGDMGEGTSSVTHDQNVQFFCGGGKNNVWIFTTREFS